MVHGAVPAIGDALLFLELPVTEDTGVGDEFGLKVDFLGLELAHVLRKVLDEVKGPIIGARVPQVDLWPVVWVDHDELCREGGEGSPFFGGALKVVDEDHAFIMADEHGRDPDPSTGPVIRHDHVLGNLIDLIVHYHGQAPASLLDVPYLGHEGAPAPHDQEDRSLHSVWIPSEVHSGVHLLASILVVRVVVDPADKRLPVGDDSEVCVACLDFVTRCGELVFQLRRVVDHKS
mmetsp:Transcript_40702/g.39304  ORF Transcript_40702/g.39304 Transcript_40702/m.39304 type:complete len:233 (+) Transcript_40702:405-1103(+)